MVTQPRKLFFFLKERHREKDAEKKDGDLRSGRTRHAARTDITNRGEFRYFTQELSRPSSVESFVEHFMPQSGTIINNRG
jgi:hypothetical protein